jgi:GxxExxY protein
MSLAFQRETYLLRQCFFEVQNEVGRGRQEEAYHQACALWFKERGLPVVSKQPHRLYLGGDEAACLFPDFVGWDSIAVELKAVPRSVSRAELVQVFDYLKCRRNRVGLLVNMGLDRVEIKRVAYDVPATECVESWDAWAGGIDGSDRTLGIGIRDALRAVYAEHTTGYGSEVTCKLVEKSLWRHGLDLAFRPSAKSYFRGTELHEAPLDCILVGGRIVLTVSALFDSVSFSANRAVSYMRALNTPWGVAADFGKTRAEFVGLRG